MGIHKWGSRNILYFALFLNISKYLKTVVPFCSTILYLGTRKQQNMQLRKEKRTCLLAH